MSFLKRINKILVDDTISNNKVQMHQDLQTKGTSHSKLDTNAKLKYTFQIISVSAFWCSDTYSPLIL